MGHLCIYHRLRLQVSRFLNMDTICQNELVQYAKDSQRSLMEWKRRKYRALNISFNGSHLIAWSALLVTALTSVAIPTAHFV